ncbi:MAG: hypothetical protein QXP98_02360 [Thermoproteus sp.]
MERLSVEETVEFIYVDAQKTRLRGGAMAATKGDKREGDSAG